MRNLKVFLSARVIFASAPFTLFFESESFVTGRHDLALALVRKKPEADEPDNDHRDAN
ncbi:MAG: hypothetical protein ACI8XZ_004527 [Gammaproteobacteria bacterium]|jgi:hypothetical protein